jgi:hypothetical protein
MRVAHLLRKYNPSEWGGTESVMLQLTAELAKLGIESVVYAPKVPPGAAPLQCIRADLGDLTRAQEADGSGRRQYGLVRAGRLPVGREGR